MKKKTSKREKQLEDRVAEIEQQLCKLQAQLLTHLTNHPQFWYTYPYTTPQPTIIPVPTPPYTIGDPIYNPPYTITWGPTSVSGLSNTTISDTSSN